jgi:rare lipoprotein A
MARKLFLALAISLTVVSLEVVPAVAAHRETGIASVYSNRLKGRRMANGDRYDPTQLIAAHKVLAFGTWVRVTNVRNKKSAILKIADRGPYRPSRIIDISPAAASRLGMDQRGLQRVTLDVVEPDTGNRELND